MGSFILWTLISFSALKANASITIVDVTGASSYYSTSGTPKIFGGTAGASTGCFATNSDGTCNNCALASMPAFGYICNERRVLPDLLLRIAVKSDKVERGYAAIYKDNTRLTTYSTSEITKGNSGYLEIRWSDLCSQMTAIVGTVNSSCEFVGGFVFKVGIDTNLSDSTYDSNTDDVTSVDIRVNNQVGNSTFSAPSTATSTDPAIYTFTLQAGDAKVYVNTIDAGTSSFPTGPTNADFKKFRLYFTTHTITTADDIRLLGAADFEITRADINSSPELTNPIVEDLSNGVTYFFIGANIDEAGNIGYFTDLLAQQSATPDFVYGLLSKDFECFVATATYGTSDAKEVLTLRKFRNYLIQHHNLIAKPFIKFYYKHSPKLSALIRNNELLKFFSRVLLWPAITFAKVSLRYGLGWAFFIFCLPITVLFLGWVWWRKIHGWWHVKKNFII